MQCSESTIIFNQCRCLIRQSAVLLSKYLATNVPPPLHYVYIVVQHLTLTFTYPFPQIFDLISFNTFIAFVKLKEFLVIGKPAV